MRKILMSLALAVLTIPAFAQVDRTKAPEPGPAPTINLDEPTSFTLKNGLRVIIVQNHKLPTVNMNLFFDVPPFAEGDKAGTTEFFGSVMRAGTDNYTKEALDEELDFNGIDLFVGSQSIGVSTLKKRLPTALGFMKEVLFNASFENQDELDKLVTQAITGLESSEKNPDVIMGRVSSALTYGTDHPWGEYATKESYNNISLQDLQAHYKTYFKPNIAYLTIVGDVTVKEAKKIAKKNFKKWKPGVIPSFDYEEPSNPSQAEIVLVDLPTATQSNISISNVQSLKKSDDDYFAALVGDNVLGGGFSSRLFKNLREDKAYTYGAYSSLDNDHRMMSTFSAGAKVRNEVTDSALMAFYDELHAIVNKPITEQEIKISKSVQTGIFALRLERPSTIASFARTIFREKLNGDFYSNYLKELNDVKISDVRSAMQQYAKPDNAQIFIVGKAEEILPSLKAMGMPIRFYDIWANETEDPTLKKDVGDITGKDILNNSITAMGGEDKLKSIETAMYKYEGFTQGINLEMVMKNKVPNMTNMVVTAAGMGEVQRMNFDGKKGGTSGMQGSAELSADEAKDMANTNPIFPELTYMNSDDLKVDNLVEINGIQTYKVIATKPSGSKEERYYAVDSGLLIRTVSTSGEGANAVSTTLTFSDYKEVDGIQTPHSLESESGGFGVSLSLTEVKYNEGVSDADFQ